VIAAPAYDLGGAVTKAVELLMATFGILDQFILKIHETFLDPNTVGVGDTALGWLKLLVWAPLYFLAMAFVWNLVEAIMYKAKRIGQPGLPLEYIKKCFQILLFATLTIAARSALTNSPMTGDFMGISYGSITAKMDQKTTTAALQPLIALDVVSSYASALGETSALRQQRILEEIAKRDPKAGSTYTNLLLYAYTPVDSVSFADLVKAGWNTVGNLFTAAPQYFGRQLLNMCIMGMTMMALIIVMGAFLYQAARTIILLVFYLKLSTLLTLVVVPFAIGILYFRSMRHAGLAILKHLLILMLVCGSLNAVVQSVFTKKVMTSAAAIAMQSTLKPLTYPVTDQEILMFEAVLDADATMKSLNMPQTPDPTGNLTVQEAVQSCMAMIKVMFIMGTMLVLISRLAELFGGLINGHWDPFQQAAQSAG